MKWYKLVILVLISSAHFSCGLKEYYYLEQVPESYINSSSNTYAQVRIPVLIDSTNEHYATGYSIFYRIYISGQIVETIASSSDRSRINPTLSSDFNSLDRIADPTTSATTSVNTFSSLHYYELELESAEIRNLFGGNGGLADTGGNINIDFSSEPPIMSIVGGGTYPLKRSNGRGAFSPEPEDRLFIGSDELKDYEKTTSQINADVAGRSDISDYAYTSMYIVAVGVNLDNFTRIYSKPTHINIFKLPDASN